MFRKLLLPLVFSAFSTGVSAAEILLENQTKTLNLAKQMAELMEAKAAAEGENVVIYIVGADARPVLIHRDPQSGFAPMDWSSEKALSSYQTRQQTKDLSSEMKVFRVDTFSFVPGLPGGVPLVLDGKRAGAIGVSGAPVAKDQAIAEVGLAVFEKAIASQD
ncbi:GlcG/HbpS family heme-binding protein [Ruegeria hyattellae]|uniref:GlcG/HbpS family heme-binding protein n=1 Tax=Ruegeria hyattellae TaxID=3233337 RepID=UPI00355BA26F